MKQIFKINNSEVQHTAAAAPLAGRQKHRFAKTTTATTGFACRALLVLALLMGWGSRAVGQGEWNLWTGNTHNTRIPIAYDDFPSSLDEYNVFRIYTSDNGVGTICTGWSNSVLKSGATSIPQGKYYVQELNCYQIPLSEFDDLLNKVKNQSGLIIATGWQQYLTKVSLAKSIIVDFEFDGTPTNTAITQTLDSRTDVSTVTLDWTGAKTTPAITSTGYKYARFYVVDQSGTPLSPTDNAHKLTVNGGTACVKATSGYYVYSGGSDITIPIVTLSCTGGDVRDYRVVCWLATTTDNINATGNDVTEEPDIDVSYTYSFVKPELTETVYKTGDIAWGSSMQADASEGAPADWGTSWAELSREQRVVWYVTDGSTKQTLALGTAAQANTWVLNLPTDKFSVSSNEAVLTGQTTFTATEWDTWGKPALIAPSGMAYADAHTYQVVCEVYETAAGTTPNVRYTFSFTKDFLGELKSGVTATTVPVVLADATATSHELTDIPLPTGAKYARFYLTNGTGTPVDPTDKLTVSGTPGTVSGHADYGYYIYNESGITAPTVTLTLTDATLNQYRVVMVASADKAVTEGVAVVNEPDWDAQTTWTFKYPVAHTEATGTVEWSPVSMTVPLDIDTHKGSGYLSTLGTDYHVVWTVEDGSGNAQALTTGTERQAGTWTYSVVGNNATFYAPTGQTFANMSNVTFVARLYETATGENDADKSLTYTVSIGKTTFLGVLKNPTATDGESITLEETATIPVTVQLGNALSGCSNAHYARVWLTQNGTMVTPTGLTVTGMTAFGTNHSDTYGYYLYSDGGISTLSDATLELASLSDYPDYEVHVALSTDVPVGINAFARAGGPLRATALAAYEPDYDYEYIFSFQEAGMKTIRIYEPANEVPDPNGGEGHGASYTADLYSRINSVFTQMGETEALSNANCFAKWVVVNADGTPYDTKDYGAAAGGVNIVLDGIEEWQSKAWINGGNQYAYGLGTAANRLKATVNFGTGVYQLGNVIECYVTNDGHNQNTDPDDGYKVKVEIHFYDPDAFEGELKDNGAEAVTTVTVGRTDASVALPLTTTAATHAKLSARAPKYARFILTDLQGNYLDPTTAGHVLSVSYGGNNGTAVTGHADYGYYVNGEGSALDLSNITVSLAAPQAYKLYRVVALFSTDFEGAIPDTGAEPLIHEPKWDLKYTYSFDYPAPTTQEIDRTMTWSRVKMQADASTADADADWGISFDELALGQYVRWYIVNSSYVKQTIALGNSRQSGQWVLGLNVSDFSVPTGNTDAVLTGKGTAFNATNWNATWGVPAVYAPYGMEFDEASTYNLVCEVAERIDATPYVRYTFSIVRGFLGEMKGNGSTGGETITIERATTTYQVPLGNALTAYAATPNSSTPKYARVWLTTTDGTLVDPSGKLTPTGMTAISLHNTEYGFFVSDDNGISLSNATLALSAGSYTGYQVHIALSTGTADHPADFARADAPRRAPEDAHEPDYDYVYTIDFDYPVERIRLDLITDAQLANTTVQFDIHDYIDSKFNHPDGNTFIQQFYTKWYIEDGNGVRQPFDSGNWTVQSNSWTARFTYGSKDDNAWILHQSNMGGNNYNVVGQLGEVYLPSGTTLESWRGYRFICEVSNDYDGENAVPSVIFWIPVPDHYVGSLKAGGTQVDQTVILEEDTKTYTLTELQTQYEDFVTSKSVTDADQVYLRLYAANVNGTLADDQTVYTFANLPADFVHIDQGWAYLGTALTADQISALAAVTVTSTSTQNLYDTGRKVGLVMAKAPFDERFYPTDAATVDAILNEPKWDYQYLLRFDQFLTTDGPTMIEETVTVRPGNAEGPEGRYTFNIANIAALSAAAKGFNAKYMRWYLADSNGNIINPQTFTQYTWGPGGWTNNTRWFITDVNPTAGMTHDHNDINRASANALKYGQMWWYTNGNTVEFDNLTFKVTTPMVGGGWGGYYHDNLQNYQVVVYLSDNDDASLLTQTTGEGPAATTTVTKEPTPDYKITIKFNPFFGDLAADATEIEQTFRQPLEEWNEDCANGAREYVISFDYTAKTVTMAKADGSGAPMTKNMSDQEYSFWSTFTNNTGTVPDAQNFYFRWFLRNKATGEMAEIENSIVSADGGAALQDVRQYNTWNMGGNSGYYYVGNPAPGSKFYTNWISTENKGLGQLLRVKIDGSPTGGDCFSLTNYDLVLLLSADDQGTGAWAEPYGEGNHYCLVREPETFDLQYTFHFTTDFEADNIDDPNLKTKYKTLIYDPVTHSATPTILSNYYEMAGDLQATREDLANKGYVRWYLVSKATGEPIPMANLTNTGDEKYTSLGNQYGYYRYKFKKDDLRAEGAYFHGFDPTITLPEGVRYQDVRIVAVFTTLTEPQDEPNQALPKDLPAREPRQMQVKYVYDLVLEETLREHWPFTHYHGIHYPLYHRSFEDSREFIGPGQPQDLPDEGTAYVNQRVWDYGKNAIYDPADNSYEAGRTYNHGGHNPDPASPDYTTRNIRQKVHTKEYNYYLLLADGEKETLKLPFQYFDGEQHSTVWSDNVRGSDAEPIGYIRWYDWKTDLNSEHITPTETTLTGAPGQNTELKQLISHVGTNTFDRGWYTIMSSLNPTQDKVGVDFVAPAGFSEMTDEIVIACDVSRYMDGLDDSKQYLVHEPTLSIRYIYHILPAKVLAKRMTDAANEYFEPVMHQLTNTPITTEMQFSDIENYDKTFHLLEYNGRTVVSVKGAKLADGKTPDPSTPATGNFSLRTSLTELDHYYVEVGGKLKPCNNLQWYAYYEYEGMLYRRKIPMVKGKDVANDWSNAMMVYEDDEALENLHTVSDFSNRKYGTEYHREDVRLAVFETKDFWGEYERVRNTSEKITFNIQPGQFLHLVGCLGYDDGAGNITEVPTVSTELYLVDAEPKLLGSEGIERTDYTMSSQYKKAAELNFDDFFDDPTTRYDKPLTSFENYAKIPMLFADAQYGFCYPRLYGQCANDYLLHQTGAWHGYGFAPLHGDYTILKSMGMEGISKTRDNTNGDGRYDRLDEQSMYPLWYINAPTSLYDITHERANQKNITETQDYGAFLYVDAAEQSRTIGRLEFDAQLCAGAEIYFTAYIADVTEKYATHATPQVRFRVYTYNTKSGYPMGTVVGDELLEGYGSTSTTVPVISFVTGDIATVGATTKGQWYQVYGYCNLPPEDRAFLEGDQRHFYVEVDNFCENTNGADYAVDQITFYTNSARVRIAQASDVCDDEKGVKLRITALASALLPHFGQGQDREIFYRIYPYSDDPEKTELEADEAITGPNVYCHEHAVDDGDRGNLYGAVPFHVGYKDGPEASIYDNTLYESLEALLEAKKTQDEYLPKYGFYKEGDEVYYLLDERYFELKAGQEYFVSLYTLGSYKPGGLDGWGNPYGNHTCTAYSNTIMPRNMYIELTEDTEVSDGVVDLGCGRTTATKDFGVRVRYPLESGGYETYDNKPFDFFLGTKSELDECYLTEMVNGEEVTVRLKDALEHFRGLKDGDNYKYPDDYTIVPEDYQDENENFYNILKKYVEDKKLLRLEAASTFHNTFTVESGLTEGIHVHYLALPVYPQIDDDKEICSPITMDFFLDPTGGAPLMELGFDDVKYPADYTKRGVRLGLEQIAKMRDKGYMLHIPISNYQDKKKKEDPNKLYFENHDLVLSGTNDPAYLKEDGTMDPDYGDLIVATIGVPEEKTSVDDENDTEEGVFVSTGRMFLPLSFTHVSGKEYVDFKEGYWYEVTTRYYDKIADANDYGEGEHCYADLFIVFKVVPEFATWDAQRIGSTHLYNVSWHNDQNWKRSVRRDLYKDRNQEGRTQNTNTAGHPHGYDNDGEGSLAVLTSGEKAALYNANPNPGFVPMKFTYVTLLTGNHAPSLINEARTTGSVQTGGFLIDPNQTELMTDTSPVDNKESSKATDDIRYDMLVRYGAHSEGGEGCFGHRSKSKGDDGKWGWRNDKRTDMTSFNEKYKAFDVEKFYGNICKEIYFKPEAELLRQQRLTYEKAWVEKELVANTWYLAASPLKSTYAGDMYVPTTMNDLSMAEPVQKPGRQMTEAFQPISFKQTAVSVTDGTATSTPAYSRTKYPIYQRSWKASDTHVYTKENDARATDYSASLGYTSVSTDFLEWSHTYNDVQVPYSTATTYGDGNTISQVSVPMGFSVRAHRKVQKDGSSNDVPALIRLPKADKTYQYYDWSDAGSTPAGGEQTVSKPDAQLTNSINGTTWNYTQPMQYRFITDDASKESSTQGAMEFNISDLQSQGDSQGDYVLVGNPVVSSLNMGEFFSGNPGLTYVGDAPTGANTQRYSYWTYEGGQAKAFLVDKTTTTHVVTIDGENTTEIVNDYVITSDGNTEVGTIRPLQAFFVKKGSADKIYFTRNMGIDGNFPVNDSSTSGTGNGDGGTGVEPGPDGGSRPFGVTLRAVCGQGGSSATVRVNDTAGDDFAEGEDVETLFDSNLADVPMVYTVAGGQAVSIDQRPQLDLVSFGVVQAKDEPVEVTVTTQHASPTTQQLYFIDALTGEQTPLADGSKVTVQPNDYGRYFISATTGVQSKTDIEHGIVISVRQQEVTVTAMGGQLSKVSATTLGGIKSFNSRGGLDTQCRFKLAKGVYIIQASTTNGQQRQLKVVVE